MDENSTDGASDHSLLRHFRDGDQDAATELYLRYAARLQALANCQTSSELASRFDAEDVVQSVFRTFFRRVSEGLYDVPPGEELWGLLLVLSLNKIRGLGSYHRAKKRSATKTLGSPALHSAGGERSSGYDENSYLTLRMVIDELLGELPENNREIIRLRIRGHEVADIAARTGRAKRTVERVLKGFRSELNNLVADD